MKEIPVKIIQNPRNLNNSCNNCNGFGMYSIGNKKTGKIIKTIKIDHSTGKQEIIFEDKKEITIMDEKIK